MPASLACRAATRLFPLVTPRRTLGIQNFIEGAQDRRAWKQYWEMIRRSGSQFLVTIFSFLSARSIGTLTVIFVSIAVSR